MALNARWHAEHPMPSRPTLEERVAWHREHARACGCRKPPPQIAALIAGERPADERRAASDAS